MSEDRQTLLWGWLFGGLYIGVVLLIGFGMYQEPLRPKAPPAPIVAEATTGPRCTPAYPRGFQVAKGTKKNPVKVCTNGDLGATWRSCTLRYNT